jgi:serine acetyltransferase
MVLSATELASCLVLPRRSPRAFRIEIADPLCSTLAMSSISGQSAPPLQPSLSTEQAALGLPSPRLQPPIPEALDLEIGFWKLIQEDWLSHGCDWTLPGFRAVAVHRFGVWRMGIRSKLLRVPMSLLYRRLYRKVRNGYGIELPYTVRLGRRVVVEHQGNIVIHGYAAIGDDSIIRQGVTIGLRHLDAPYDVPELGQGVNVGAGAKLFGKIQIGNGAQIGANAVVLQSVPAGATAVGIPARILDKG